MNPPLDEKTGVSEREYFEYMLRERAEQYEHRFQSMEKRIDGVSFHTIWGYIIGLGGALTAIGAIILDLWRH